MNATEPLPLASSAFSDAFLAATIWATLTPWARAAWSCFGGGGERREELSKKRGRRRTTTTSIFFEKKSIDRKKPRSFSPLRARPKHAKFAFSSTQATRYCRSLDVEAKGEGEDLIFRQGKGAGE